MTDSHTDNEISVLLLDTTRPSDSLEAHREVFHHLYLHENADHLDTPPIRDDLENEDTGYN